MKSSLLIICLGVAGFVSLLALPHDAESAEAAPPLLARPDAPARIDPEQVCVLLIDAQPSFWKIMAGDEKPVMARIEQLLVWTDVTKVPLIATFEHDPKRNGWLPENLEAVFPEHGQRLVKRTFDCCRESEIAAALKKTKRRQVVVAGAETDVCVLQSVLGLLEMGFEVFVLEDCLFTNEPNVRPALDRMRQAGAVPSTYKTFYFEMTKSVDWKSYPPAWEAGYKRLRKKIVGPYRLPPSVVR